MPRASSLLRKHRPAAWTAAALLGCAALYACDDLLVNPRQHPQPRSSSLAVRLQLAGAMQSGGAREAFDKANRLRVRVTRGDQSVKDTTVDMAPAGQDTRLTLELVPQAEGDSVGVAVSLLRDAAELFRGGARAGLRTGQVVAVDVPIEPVAASIAVPDSLPPLASVGDTAQLTGSLLFATGDTVPAAALAWTSLDPAVADVAEGSKAVARANGQARMVATSGALADTTLVPVRQVVRAIVTTVPTDTLLVGDTVTYGAAPVDARRNPVPDAPVTWMTTSAGVVDVSPAGVVTARGVGQGSVLAMADGFTAEVKVTVKTGAALVVGAAGAIVSTPGDTVRLEIPAGALSSPVRIAVSPQAAYPASPRVVPGTPYHFAPDGTHFSTPATLSVRYDPARVPAAYGAGELRLHRMSAAGWDEVPGSTVDTVAHVVRGPIDGFSAYGVLARVQAATLDVTPDSARLFVGATVQLAAALRDSAGGALAGRTVAWSTSDAAVATVSADGLVKAAGAGRAAVRAASGGAIDSAVVTVLALPAFSRLVVSPDSAVLTSVGDTARFSATGQDQYGAPIAFPAPAWSTPDTSVATVDGTGLVRARAGGTARIVASAAGVADTALVRVAQAAVSIDARPDSAAIHDSGEPVAAAATVYDARHEPIGGARPAWTSSAPAVATVDSLGEIRGVADGAATIRAGLPGATGDSVAVRVRLVARVAVDSAISSLVGDTGQLTAHALDAAGDTIAGRVFTYTSSDTTVLRIDPVTGVGHALAVGTAVVTSSQGTQGIHGTTVFTVSAGGVARVDVTPDSAYVAPGRTLQLSAAAYDAADRLLAAEHLTWSTANGSVATVDSTGLVTALGIGDAPILAKASNGVYAFAYVRVAQNAARVVVTPDTATLVAGAFRQLLGSAKDSSGTSIYHPIRWQTSDSTVARVNGSGGVTGVGPGTALIVASANGPADTATVTVRPAPPVARVVATPDSLVIRSLYGTATITAQAYDTVGAPLTQDVYFRYTSLDPGLLFANPNSGQVEALGVGTARVVVSYTPDAPPTSVTSRAPQPGAPRFGVAASTTTTTTTGPSSAPADTVLVRIYQEPARIAFTPSAVELNDPGDAVTPAATVQDSLGSPVPGAQVTWQAKDASIATVSAGGTIQGVANGATFARAAYGAVRDSLPVTVRLVASVTVTPAAPELTLGDSVALSAVAYDAGGTTISGRRFYFSSSNPSVATVDSLGTVHALAVGTATVTASQGTQGIAGQSRVTVSVFALGHVSASYDHTCALTPGLQAWCWGSGAHGQLGTGGTAGSSYPVQVSGAPQLVAISAGFDHTCGLAYDATGAGSDAYCWGANDDGQIGLGAAGADVTAPTLVPGGLRWRAISAAYNTTCGVDMTADVWCWGVNTSGEAGVAPSAPVAFPSKVEGGHVWNAVTQGSGFACGLDTAGAAWCWGSNDSGQLGSSTFPSGDPTPVAVPGGHVFGRIVAGLKHVCALDTAGAVWCWGPNSFGQLGAGDAAPHDGPVKVLTPESFRDLSGGGYHTCATTALGALYCWGRGASGELGDGGTADRWTPTAVTGIGSVADGGSGWWGHCVVSSGNVGYCWGLNDAGQLGDGSTVASSSPVVVHAQPSGGTASASRGTAAGVIRR